MAKASFSFFIPTFLKFTVAEARSPAPSTAITLPLPNERWWTCAPGTMSPPPDAASAVARAWAASRFDTFGPDSGRSDDFQ